MPLVWWKLQYEKFGFPNNIDCEPAHWALKLSFLNSQLTNSAEIVHKRKLGRLVFEISQYERSLKREHAGFAQRNHYFEIVKPRWDSKVPVEEITCVKSKHQLTQIKTANYSVTPLLHFWWSPAQS